MKRLALAMVPLSLLSLTACGSDEPSSFRFTCPLDGTAHRPVTTYGSAARHGDSWTITPDKLTQAQLDAIQRFQAQGNPDTVVRVKENRAKVVVKDAEAALNMNHCTKNSE